MIKKSLSIILITAFIPTLFFSLLIVNKVYSRDSDSLKISGFFSIGAGITDVRHANKKQSNQDPEAPTNTNLDIPKYSYGSGRFLLDDDPNFGADTRGALQFDIELTETVTSTLQLVGYGSEDFYRTQWSWAYLSFSLTPNSMFRVGRLRTPIYMVSDYLDVDFAYPWISAPIEVYTVVNMDNTIGLDWLYDQTIGQWRWFVQPFLGSSDFKRGDFTSEFRHIFGLSTSLSHRYGLVRLGYMEYEFGIKPWPLNATHKQVLQAMETQGAVDLVNYYKVAGDISRVYVAGFKIDLNDWEFLSEWVRRDNSKAGPDVEGAYFTLNYNHYPWQFHSTYALRTLLNKRQLFHRNHNQLDSATQATLVAFLNAVRGIEDNEAESFNVGINYFANEAIALKADLTQTHNIKSSGFYEYATKNSVNHVIRISVDAIF